MHKVVILGGGFAGLYAAKALRKAPVEVTLIDRRNFHLFQPLLYQVATGSLSPGDIAAPLRSVLSSQKNARVLLGEAVDVDPGRRVVILEDGDEIAYDTLLVATGASNQYFGHDEWAEHAPGLKSVEDATEMRHRIFRAFEAAERECDRESRCAWLTFLVVGGGPTGVELAGALGEIANDTLKHDFRSIRPEESRILLLEGGDRLLGGFPPELSAAAEKSLLKAGVRTRVNVRVTAIDERGVDILAAGEKSRIEARTVLWAAGVAPSPLGKLLRDRAGAPLDRQGRVIVEANLTVPGHPEILVLGDLAHIEDGGKALPGVAQVAMQGGKYAANLIRARLQKRTIPPFRYADRGNMAVIGRNQAVADIRNWHFDGLFAWLLWLFIHLMYLVQFRSRLVVFLQWGLEYLSYNRSARLITGTDMAPAGKHPEREIVPPSAGKPADWQPGRQQPVATRGD